RGALLHDPCRRGRRLSTSRNSVSCEVPPGRTDCHAEATRALQREPECTGAHRWRRRNFERLVQRLLEADVDVLHVVVFVERLEELLHFGALFALELDRALA